MNTPGKDYTHHSWLAAAALIAVLVAVSFIPPQSVGGVKLRRANILSDLLSFDDAEAAEPAAEPALFDEEEFHIDMAAVAERIEADTTPREVQITYGWLLAQDTARRERAVPDSARFVATLTPIEDFSDSGRIQAFCDTLLNAPRPVRIAFLGDSFVEGDILTADLRERLQSAYSGGGAGFAPMASPLTAFRRTVKTQSKGWTTYNIMQRKAAPARLRENFSQASSAGDKPMTRKELFAALDAPLHGLMPDDINYASEVDAALSRRPAFTARALSVAVALLVVALLVWAAWAPIDEVTHAEGSVVGSRRTQSVSNLEGGILQAVLVREGEVVEKGQVVAQLENVMAESSYRDALYKLVEHRLAIMRLEAMLRDEEPVFPSDLPVFLKEILGEEPDGVLVERARQIVDDQRNTWKAQSSKLRAELSMLEAQYAQRQSEVAEQLARKKQLDGSLVLETEQRDTAKRLLQRNNYSRMDYLGLEQKIIQTQGEIDMLAAAIPKTQAMMDEARQRIGSRVAEEQLAISQEINKRRTELGSVRESLTAGGDRVTRTEVRSPVRGSVKQILVNTVGGVVKPGEAIMDIVPMDESLLVEVRVRPQDVAFLRPGQDVMIKVSAYDFSIYGGLPGKLESISADTIEDKKGDFYYLVKVRTGETAIRRNDEILPIIPGMIVVADIIIGKKTVLDYILKPVMKARQNALTER